jgi:hypothetical protein
VRVEKVRGRRLKGLEEFVIPPFVGRMARVRRARQLSWLGVLAGAVGAGLAIGWFAV